MTPTQEALAANLADQARKAGSDPVEIWIDKADLALVISALSQPAVGAQPLPAQQEPNAICRRCNGSGATPPAPSEPAQPVPAGEWQKPIGLVIDPNAPPLGLVAHPQPAQAGESAGAQAGVACSLGCTTDCLAEIHGCKSECPALPHRPPFTTMAAIPEAKEKP